MDNHLFVGIDVGGTKISAGLVESRGKILLREKYSTPKTSKPQDILDTIIDILNEVLDKKSRPRLKGIGIGIPGIINTKTNKILVTPNTNLSNFPLHHILAKKYKVKVVLGNDVNLGLLGEQWLGAAKKAQNVIGLFPGTGIGGGIILDGKLITGTIGTAAELGHMIMDISGPPCSCGNYGCLEALASRWAIERDIREAVKKGETTILTELTDGKLKTIKSKFLKIALKKKDPLVTEVMSNVAATLGKACISIKHIFNPEMIVFGGGVIEACGDFILPKVQKIADNDPFFSKFDHCPVVASKLGDDAVILGAVALVKDHLRK